MFKDFRTAKLILNRLQTIQLFYNVPKNSRKNSQVKCSCLHTIYVYCCVTYYPIAYKESFTLTSCNLRVICVWVVLRRDTLYYSERNSCILISHTLLQQRHFRRDFIAHSDSTF